MGHAKVKSDTTVMDVIEEHRPRLRRFQTRDAQVNLDEIRPELILCSNLLSNPRFEIVQ